MASEVEICNLAVSYLGDTPSIASIDPPEGSPHAEYCARMYPLARDILLEMHNWRFATRTMLLAALTSDHPSWDYAYAKPSAALKVLEVIPSDGAPVDTNLVPIGVPFELALDATGATVIYTNLPNAAASYTVKGLASGDFPPSFTQALAWQMASMLAGVVVKGDSGAAMAKQSAQMMASYLGQAKIADSMQRHDTNNHIAPWLRVR